MQNIPTKNTGDTLTAAEFNDLPDELENTITSTGIVLSGADLTQLVQSVSVYAAGGSFYTESGSSTAYVLGVIGAKVAPPAYFEGMSVSFVAINANSTATPTIEVAGLSVQNIVVSSGVPLEVGDISDVGVTTLVYDGTDFTYPGVFAGRTKSYGDVASMEADSGLQIGQRVTLKGYDAVGDGGGKAGTVVAGATGTADGGAFHDLASGNQFQLEFSGQIKAAWYGVLPGTTDRAARFQLAVDFCSPSGIELLLPEGTIPLDSIITISSEGLNISGTSRKNCIIEADGDYTVFEHTVRLVCRNFSVVQTSGSSEGIAFGTPRSDASSAQAVYCIFDNIDVTGFDYSWWWRCSIWNSWENCHSASLVGIRFARNADPYDLGVPDAPGGWNIFSPTLGWFHNVGTIHNVNFEDDECGIWGCPMSYDISGCTTQTQNGAPAGNKLLPLTEERTGIWLHSGNTGTRNAWANSISAYYAEATERPLYIQDQRILTIDAVFSQGNTMGSPFTTPLQVNNSIVYVEGWSGQDWWTEFYILTNSAKLFGKTSGAVSGNSTSVDSTSSVFENREQEEFSHQFSFTSTGTQTTTIPVTLENNSHYELHVGALFDGTTVETETYDIFRWNSDALTNIDTRSGGGTNFNVTVSGAQILVNATHGSLALATDVTLREVTKSITQDIALTPV